MATDEAIVLVGGLGTRLRTVVSDVPKPLAPVAGRPFLAWVLDRLAEENIRHVVLAVGYMADKVQEVIGGRWRGIQIDYSVEDSPLGTGGALQQASSMLQGNGVHVLNGDTYLRYSMRALEKDALCAEADIGMSLAQVEDLSRYGAVKLSGRRVTGFCEKGEAGAGLINAGCYFLTPRALSILPSALAYSFETEVLRPMVAAGKVFGFDQTEGFIDIGVPQDYQLAQAIFAHV